MSTTTTATTTAATTTTAAATTTTAAATTTAATTTNDAVTNKLINTPLSIQDALFYGLTNPLFFGQLWARSNNFNSSTDMPWLMFLSYIPFGDLFSLLYLSTTQQKLIPGNNISFIDKFVMLPVIGKLILSIFDIDESIQYTILIILIGLSNINRRKLICGNITSQSIGKIIIDTIIIFCLTELLTIFIYYIPGINSIFDTVTCINQSSIIVWILSYTIIYSQLNFYNQIDINNRYCNAPVFGTSFDIAPLCIFLMTLLFVKITNVKHNDNSTNSGSSIDSF